MNVSATYCPLLFRELAVKSNGDLSPCCRTKPIPGESASDIEKAWNSQYLNNLRQKSLNNIPIDQCNRCYLEEKHGRKSLRQDGIIQYGTPTDHELKGLHLSLSNLCNIKCRHCGHHSSSKWYTDSIKMQMPIEGTALVTSNFNLLSLDLNKIDRLQFYGGEPFLHHEEITEILEFKRKHGTLDSLTIALGTNGTTKMPQHLLQLISKAKQVWFAFSIDAVEEFAEYFRSGTDWQLVTENINAVFQIFQNKSHIQVAANTTINIYNINVLKKIEQYLATHWPLMKQQKTALSWPRCLSARNLPESYKNIVRTRHQYNSHWDRYTLNLLNELPIDKFDNFITWHKKLDAVRTEKLEEFNPELAKWIESYTNTKINHNSYNPADIK